MLRGGGASSDHDLRNDWGSHVEDTNPATATSVPLRRSHRRHPRLSLLLPSTQSFLRTQTAVRASVVSSPSSALTLLSVASVRGRFSPFLTFRVAFPSAEERRKKRDR